MNDQGRQFVNPNLSPPKQGDWGTGDRTLCEPVKGQHHVTDILILIGASAQGPKAPRAQRGRGLFLILLVFVYPYHSPVCTVE